MIDLSQLTPDQQHAYNQMTPDQQQAYNEQIYQQQYQMGQQQFVNVDGQPMTQEQYQQLLAAQQNMGYDDGMGQEYDEMVDDG